MTFRSSSDLESYRPYLRVLAGMQMNPRLRTKEDLSDVVQITLMRAHQDLPAFRGTSDGEFRAWLKTVLNHTLINLAQKYQAQKRDIRLEQSIDARLHESADRLAERLTAVQTSPSERAMRQERAEQLAGAMSRLLDDECTAVLLKHVHDWKVAEIASYLDRSPEGVAGLLRRGLSKLRKSMQQHDR